MEEQTQQTNQDTQQNNQTVDISPQTETPNQPEQIDVISNSFRSPILFRDTAPILPNPATFKEQFYLYKNGGNSKLYVNIDGTWVDTSGGINVAIGSGSSGNTYSEDTIECGFQPKSIQIISKIDDGSTAFTECNGFQIVAGTTCVESHQWKDSGGTVRYGYGKTYIINLYDTSNNTANVASISEITSTGFKIYWANSAKHCTYIYHVLG